MRTLQDIERLLDRLEITVADELEAQDLDFMEWDAKIGVDPLLIVHPRGSA